MADATKALSFLTKDDAIAFADKYIDEECEPYISKKYTVLVRVDNNTNIPTYMAEDSLLDNRNKLNSVQTANLNSDVESADQIIDDDLKDLNAKKKVKIERSIKVASIIDELVNYVANLPSNTVVHKTGLGDVQVQFKLVKGRSTLNPTLDLRYRISRDLPDHQRSYDYNHDDNQALIDTAVDLSPGMRNAITEKVIKVNPASFMLKDPYYSYNSQLFAFRVYPRSIEYSLRVDIYVSEYMASQLFNKYHDDIKLLKEKFKKLIDEYIPQIITDLNTGAKEKERIEKIIEEVTASEKVEVGYGDF